MGIACEWRRNVDHLVGVLDGSGQAVGPCSWCWRGAWKYDSFGDQAHVTVAWLTRGIFEMDRDFMLLISTAGVESAVESERW